MRPEKRRNTQKLLFFFLKTGTAALILYLLLRKTPYEDFARNFRQISWGWFVAAAFLHVVGYIVSAHRWRILLLAQGLKPSLWDLIKSYVIATFFNYILLGTVLGDIYRAYDTGAKSKKGVQAVSAVFVERVTGVVAMMFLAAIGILFLLLDPTRLSTSAFWNVRVAVAICAGILLFLLAVVFVFIHPRTVEIIANRLDRPAPLFGKLRQIFLSLNSAITVYRSNPMPIYKNLFWALVLQLNVVAHWFLVGLAMGLPSLSFFSYMVVVPAITLVLMIPVTPGGIGVREWTVWAFRTPLGFAAATSSPAAAALMSWLLVATVLFYGTVGFLMFTYRLFSARRSKLRSLPTAQSQNTAERRQSDM